MSKSKTLKYKILPEHKLIIDCWFGELTFDKILQAKLVQVEDEDWSPEFSNISDIRNAIFVLSEDEARKIIEYARSDPKWTHKRKTAYLTENPNQVVFQIMLNKNMTDEMPNELDAFSTLEAALKWLNIHEKEKQHIQDIIEELKKQP